MTRQTSRFESARRGFTLVEVTIALVILGLIGAAATKLLMVQSRYYDKMTNVRNARNIARSSMNVLMSDLRMVQDVSGVESASSDGKSLQVIVPYRFGLVCSASLLTTTVSMLPADSATVAQSTYAGFAWRDTTTGLYHYMTTNTPAAASNPATCTGNSGGQAQIRNVSMNGRSGAPFDLTTSLGVVGNSPPVATSVFFWSRIVYSFKTSKAYPAYLGLYRTILNGASAVVRDEELLAPFDTSSRFRYYVAGDDTSRTVVPAANQIRGVDFVLNALSPKATSEKNGTNSPSYMRTSVFFKNVSTF